MNTEKTKPSEEQIIYADLLGIGTLLAILMLVIGFIVYLSGLLPNVVDFERLQDYWRLRVSEYIHQTNSPTGWGWVGLLNHGDMLNYLGVSMLAGLTIVCYLRLLPVFIKKGDKAYTIIILIEIAVLLLAASGILTAGGH